MPTSTPPTDPDGLAVLHALSAPDPSPEDVYNAVQGLRNMAGQNVIAAIDAHKSELTAKLDAQDAKLDAISSAQDTRLRMLMWMIGAAVAVIGIFVRLWG